jgi:hypothetical protein
VQPDASRADAGTMAPTGGSGGSGGAGSGGTGGSDQDAGSDEGPAEGGLPDGGAPDTGPPDAGPGDADTCPGRRVELSGSPPSAVIQAHTADFIADYIPSTACAASSDLDAVYHLTAPTTGTLRITMDTPSAAPSFAPQLYVRSPTCDAVVEIACQSLTNYLADAVLTLPVLVGTELYIFADQSYGTMDAPFTLTIEYL